MNTSVTSQYDESSSVKPNGISNSSSETAFSSGTPVNSHPSLSSKYESTSSAKLKTNKKHKGSVKASQTTSSGGYTPPTVNNLTTSNALMNSASSQGTYLSPSAYSLPNNGYSSGIILHQDQSLNDPTPSGYSIQNILNFAYSKSRLLLRKAREMHHCTLRFIYYLISLIKF